MFQANHCPASECVPRSVGGLGPMWAPCLSCCSQLILSCSPGRSPRSPDEKELTAAESHLL